MADPTLWSLCFRELLRGRGMCWSFTLFNRNAIFLCRITCLESIPGEFKNLSQEGTLIMLTNNVNHPNTGIFFRYIWQGYIHCVLPHYMLWGQPGSVMSPLPWRSLLWRVKTVRGTIWKIGISFSMFIIDLQNVWVKRIRCYLALLSTQC